MRPARQHLETHEALGAHLYQRLKMWDDKVVGNRLTQFALKQRARLDMSVHAGLEEAETASSIGLCPVKRHIGAAYERIGGLALGLCQSQPDADANLHYGSIGEFERRLQRCDDPPRDLGRSLAVHALLSR